MSFYRKLNPMNKWQLFYLKNQFINRRTAIKMRGADSSPISLIFYSSLKNIGFRYPRVFYAAFRQRRLVHFYKSIVQRAFFHKRLSIASIKDKCLGYFVNHWFIFFFVNLVANYRYFHSNLDTLIIEFGSKHHNCWYFHKSNVFFPLYTFRFQIKLPQF